MQAMDQPMDIEVAAPAGGGDRLAAGEAGFPMSMESSSPPSQAQNDWMMPAVLVETTVASYT